MNNTEKNIIIAKWLGWQFDEWNMLIFNDFITSQPTFKTDLKFDVDMNWLYLCIEKIAEIEYNKNGSPKTLVQVLHTIRGIKPIFTIEAVFEAVFNYANKN